jgi:hypothetical protein
VTKERKDDQKDLKEGVKEAIGALVQEFKQYNVDIQEYEGKMQQLLEQDIRNLSRSNKTQQTVEQEEEVSKVDIKKTQNTIVENVANEVEDFSQNQCLLRLEQLRSKQ